LWKLPEWTIVHAQGDLLEGVTVNEAEYQGVIRGLAHARALGLHDLYVIGDSRIVIQQCQGVIQCRSQNLLALHDQVTAVLSSFATVHFLHVKREFNASADYLTVRALRLQESGPVSDTDELALLTRLNGLPERLVAPTEQPASPAAPAPNAPSPPARPRARSRGPYSGCSPCCLICAARLGALP
jgi:ribonuclease HI